MCRAWARCPVPDGGIEVIPSREGNNKGNKPGCCAGRWPVSATGVMSRRRGRAGPVRERRLKCEYTDVECVEDCCQLAGKSRYCKKMSVVTPSTKSKTRTARAAAKPASRAAGKRGSGKAKSKGRPQKHAGPVDDRAVRRAVGAAMFNPEGFLDLYAQSAEQRAKHWAEVQADRGGKAR
jgi:hypothetical protein